MIVVDCSVLMNATSPDESENYALNILNLLAMGKIKAMVPALFYLESTNVLLSALKKKRISIENYNNYLHVISNLPLDVDHSLSRVDTIMNISLLAQKFTLSSYDACYLELAISKKIPLATLNKALQQAAKHCQLFYI